MKILFDGFWFISGPPSQRHVLREMVTTWLDQFPGDEVGLVVRARDADEARRELPSRVTLFPSRAYPHAVVAAVSLSRSARRWRADAVLAQNFAARFRRGVSAVFLHDVLFVDHPEWFTPTERAYFSFMPRLAPRADVVFTSTSTEAARIRSRSKPRSVLAVGIGLSKELVQAVPDDRVRTASPVEAGSYVLAVGRLNVRKNLARVIEGCLDAGVISRERPLLIVGAGDGRSDVETDAQRRAVDSGVVRFAGFVSDGELRWLYENASCTVFASLGEGFGMPPVEAAYFGSEIVVSDLPVFHETVGSVAHFVNPLSPPAIAAGVASALQPAEARATSVAPEAWQARYDWSVSVASMRRAVQTHLETKRTR
ncbi:glycosyltransferase involved in cell wall biosynthesis [Frigoribacterium sp. PhB160]|uniref:glycosyltransferase family 4 protein n=1 Tax=Frigoribacterium sp. PhB160 TaxID=2485192 RepID=UPI000F4AE29A|nr:glycosyltransferase family 1 protein [Frigoribacterium sp. PhB160]ROS60972.1 glycosyltransferase involved in cell wall biosynthesis [Frigoribacterium sp. PhB160]